jgi:hypothetical protein
MAAFLVFIVTALCMAGCGSGGGGTTAAAPTQAIITLSTQGTPSLTPLNSAQVILTLPAGVTVAADQNGNTSNGVVKASGTATGAEIVSGNYTPATSTTQGTVKVFVVKSAGFSAGEFATVTCNFTGATPSATSFNATDLTAYNGTVDANGTPVSATLITGLSPALTADFK